MNQIRFVSWKYLGGHEGMGKEDASDSQLAKRTEKKLYDI